MDRPDLLPGTLDMLVLRTLHDGPRHGYAISQAIRRTSQDVLAVEQGSLYPALYRMEKRGWIKARWGVSDTNRRVKMYELTRGGRTQLTEVTSNWETFVAAVGRIMKSGG